MTEYLSYNGAVKLETLKPKHTVSGWLPLCRKRFCYAAGHIFPWLVRHCWQASCAARTRRSLHLCDPCQPVIQRIFTPKKLAMTNECHALAGKIWYPNGVRRACSSVCISTTDDEVRPCNGLLQNSPGDLQEMRPNCYRTPSSAVDLVPALPCVSACTLSRSDFKGNSFSSDRRDCIN